MIFNSLQFAIFFPVVFLLYWFVFNKSLKVQNLFLVIASFIFYGWWNWKLVLLLGGISLSSYLAGICIEKTSYGKIFNLINILIGIGILWAFKYYDFFASEFAHLLQIEECDKLLLHLVLPAGLSFYVLRGISYTIDVQKGNIPPERDPIIVFAYISFFPQLLAGPIAKPKDFLPQLSENRMFKYEQGVDGLRQILWGLFKKLVIADNCSIYVNNVFANIANYNGSTLLLAAILYSFQIYADFSGYSDMAIGIGKLLGFSSKRNFNYPYFSRNIAEFWRRWHISLTSWFVEYIYIPLGGSRVPKHRIIFNTFIIFLISGLWHGANWTFILWGCFHALLFIPLIVTGKNKMYKNSIVAQGKKIPTAKDLLSMSTTFTFATLGWILFRSPDLTIFTEYICGIFSPTIFSVPFLGKLGNIAFALPIMIIAEWLYRDKEYGFDISNVKSPSVRHIAYISVLIIIFACAGHTDSFIYFQF